MRRYSRQLPLYAAIAFVASELPSGFTPILQLPPKSIELSGFVDITEAFDGVTSDTISVGTEAAPTGYLAATTAKAVDRLALTVAEGVNATKKTIGITRTTVGGAANAAGEGVLVFGYVQVGRHTENFGELDGGPVTA